MTRDHPSTQALAEHAEDLLDVEAAAAVQAHLADCADCRRVVADLTAVRTQLALDDPGPMPELVARRLDRALDAAAADRWAQRPAAGARPVASARARRREGATAASPATGIADRRRAASRRRRRAGAGLLAAAAVAVVALAGSLLHLGGQDRATSSASEGSAPGAEAGSAAGAPAVPGAQSLLTPRETRLVRAALVEQLRTASRNVQSNAASPYAATVPKSTGAGSGKTAPACRLTRVDAVPGRVLELTPETVGNRRLVLVTLRVPDGRRSAVALPRCDRTAPVLARVDAP